MNQTGKAELDFFWDTMRMTVSPDRYVLATLLIHIIRKKLFDMEITDDKFVFNELLEIAYSVGKVNPFDSMEHFKFVYNAARRLKETDWVGAFERELHITGTGRFAMSPALVDLYLGRFEKLPETVYVAETEKFIPGLQKYVSANPDTHFILNTYDSLYSYALTYVFENFKNVEIVSDYIYIPEFTDKNFDLIVSCPPFSGSMYGDNYGFICKELDLVILQNLSRHLNDGGRLITLHPMRVTYSLDRVEELRRFIQTKYTIKEMAQLPVGTIPPTAIMLFMLDIENSTPGVQDTLVRRYTGERSKGRKGVIDTFSIKEEMYVKFDAIIKQGDWNIDKMFPVQNSVYCECMQSGVPIQKLKDVADVLRGMTVSQNQKNRDGNIATVSISNIGERDIDYNNLERIQEDKKKVSRFLLEDGDLLISTRGATIRSAVFHEQPYPCIATSNVMVIRPHKDKLDSTYLKIFIDSPAGREMISSIQQSGVIMNISYKEVAALEIPVLDMTEQQKRALEYNEAFDRYQRAISDAQTELGGVLCRVQKFY